ncbi:U4/U6 small nuclear ribonucleo protein Prp4 [Lepidopterella palustris CBS 459.81]|uniref:U4/U6 small nuclear ribonucleo protein Prp4 n=1 Tax=Lepidopterella palustris CBS 459.81 TaxID=1314670 RepID=A0A8E2E5S1_9PEZI|nr:U4/U6 small nuclear ribonucleo protein Prp4 [Lepidopterella palustris CBS 459.81]
MGGIDLANVPLDRDYLMPAGAGVSSEKASAILSQFDRKRRAAAIAVPTADAQVKARLRLLGEPITLFGEGPGDRRDRLRELLTLQAEGAEGEDGERDIRMGDAQEGDSDEGDDQEEFYTTGTDDLLQARKDIARYSLPRAKDRVAYQKEEATISLKTHVNHRKGIKERLQGFDLHGSQIAAERPVGIVRFSPNGEYIAAGNWAGGIKLLDVPNLEEKKFYRGHADRVTGVSWLPGATLPGSNISSSSMNFASGGGGGDVKLWSLDNNAPLATLCGHTERVCRIEFHPSGRYLASASEDTSWRLWDVTTGQELLVQEGHAKEVYAVSFNTDGSLLASVGLDSIGRIWDIRTGRVIYVMESHIKPIYAVDWSVDGYRVLTGSGDGFAKCWDIRATRETNNIGANTGGVTDLRWFKGTDGPASGKALQRDEDGTLIPKKAGTFFVSCGFDKSVNIFSADDWALCKSLKGHSGNVLSTDVTNDGKWICSSGHDRTVKLWARDDQEGI